MKSFFKRLWNKVAGNTPKRKKVAKKVTNVKVESTAIPSAQGNKLRHWEIARSYLGTKEIKGADHNPIVVGFFQKSVGMIFSDETAWCAAFIGAVLYEAGLPNTGKLNARSYLKYGTPVSKPQVGDIVVFWRGRRKSWTGHVALFSHFDDRGNVVCLGGNQSDKVCYSTYSSSKVLGYRRV